jgi:hypothetical protein
VDFVAVAHGSIWPITALRDFTTCPQPAKAAAVRPSRPAGTRSAGNEQKVKSGFGVLDIFCAGLLRARPPRLSRYPGG